MKNKNKKKQKKAHFVHFFKHSLFLISPLVS